MAKKDRKYYMSKAFQQTLGNQPRTHENCKAVTGVQRPGKTAKDRDK